MGWDGEDDHVARGEEGDVGHLGAHRREVVGKYMIYEVSRGQASLVRPLENTSAEDAPVRYFGLRCFWLNEAMTSGDRE